MVVGVLDSVGLAVGGRNQLLGLDKPVLSVPGVLPAAVGEEVSIEVIRQCLVLRRGVEMAAGGRDDVGRVGSGRVDDRHDLGQREVGAGNVVGFKREVPGNRIGSDSVALHRQAVDGHDGGIGGVASQPHSSRIGDGGVLVEGVGRIGLGQGLPADGF